jgi:hypothetical protein
MLRTEAQNTSLNNYFDCLDTKRSSFALWLLARCEHSLGREGSKRMGSLLPRGLWEFRSFHFANATTVCLPASSCAYYLLFFYSLRLRSIGAGGLRLLGRVAQCTQCLALVPLLEACPESNCGGDHVAHDHARGCYLAQLALEVANGLCRQTKS